MVSLASILVFWVPLDSRFEGRRKMIRRVCVRLHRWMGLAMALFLIIEGLTGSLLAFNVELTRLLNPKLFVSRPSPDAKPLDLAALVEKAELIDPFLRVAYFARFRDDQVILRCHGRKNPQTGVERDLGFMYVILDPYSGKELGRLLWCGYEVGAGALANLMPFVFDVHTTLKLGETGSWILSAIALVWSIDCFIGFYLTLPITSRAFWKRWKPAWLVKRRSGAFRLNFDLHRAGGLWFWLALFIFAWSSVHLIDKFGVYDKVMTTLFHSPLPIEMIQKFYPNRPVESPNLDWREAQAVGKQLMKRRANAEGFNVVKPVGLNYFPSSGLYNYIAETDSAFPKDNRATIFFDGQTGAFHANMNFHDEDLGNTTTNWLRALHMVQNPVQFLLYRILVAVTGLAIVMLAITGVYLWSAKRRARLFSRSSRLQLASQARSHRSKYSDTET